MNLSVIVRFHRLATREAYAASSWYRERSANASSKFRRAVNAATTQIIENRATHSLEDSDFRYVRVKNFPYRLIYRIEDARNVFIVAVAHDRRRPGYWARRK
jgi:mRNA-degrading endonuclease RelE of RelBE toxin-antitoxin system